MKAKQLVVLVVLLAVAVIIAALMGGGDSVKDDGDGLAEGAVLMPELPLNEVAQVVISGSEDSVELERKDGKWTVASRGGYSADFTKISRILKNFRDLKVAEVVRAAPGKYGRFELNDAKQDKSGLLVELKTEGGKGDASLMLGKRYSGATDQSGRQGGGNGRYVRVPGNDKQVFIVSDSLYDIDAKPSAWLERNPFGIQKPKAVNLVQSDGVEFKFDRKEEGADVVLEGLAEDEELNTTNTGSITAPFASFSFKDVVVGDDADPEKTGLKMPVMANVSTFEGFNYALKLGQGAGENVNSEEQEATVSDARYYLSYSVSAELPDQRVAQDDEKIQEIAADATEEDKKSIEEQNKAAEGLKKQRDDEFVAEQKRLKEKLAKEKLFAGIVYELDNWSAEKFFKKRDELVKKKEKPETPGAGGAPTGLPPGLPPGLTIPGLPGAGIPGITPSVPELPAEEDQKSAPAANEKATKDESKADSSAEEATTPDVPAPTGE
ncbi:MAG: DUF4340 domain-containing protein [Verrucomicrobiaceae bacterium]|nr:DUF4340 domain-containing protein [Verrucomicrobiaceae bacterium]